MSLKYLLINIFKNNFIEKQLIPFIKFYFYIHKFFKLMIDKWSRAFKKRIHQKYKY